MNKILKIGIFSGKGGVGKTTICASLAILLAEHNIKIVVADADVDAPNLSILFSINNQTENELTVQTTAKAYFVREKCIQCRRCVSEKFCNFDAIHWNSDLSIPVIDFIACEGCRACQLLCPQEAFDVKLIDSGKISELKSKFNFSVITGETILGAQTSGKLVTEMKKYAERVSESQNANLILYDGPPGIGCPVIAAVSGLDYVIVIMEPTSSSLHDAQRFIKLPEKFQIPYGIILNKANISLNGSKLVKKYLNEKKIDLLGEIPLDKDWPFSVAKHQTFIQYRPQSPASSELRNITIKLIDILQKKEKFIGN